ncbi:hypothetical protein [Plebeiibacterium marinum]|uniref:Uncharacterized protein n=1 Tax=Plebeiibacterium marinum TaxID=2992111 RepID=A0AAE3SK58_9BACT|nr:hypothetical protein [Plebeiobacterium marinum]MCW3805105.1 hypothetical protein [Plebeiobacterium marinum]
MKYLSEILWYLSWPLLIVISYQAVKWFINKFEKQEAQLEESKDNFDI